MKRDIHIRFTRDELVLLIASLNAYESMLEDNYRRTERFYNAYTDLYRKTESEKNLVSALVMMKSSDDLKNRLLSHIPAPADPMTYPYHY